MKIIYKFFIYLGKIILNDCFNSTQKTEIYNKIENHIVKLEDLGPKFDVFSFSEKIGRENVLLNVSSPIFNYNNINKFINFSKFPDFINQIRIGYNSNPNLFYHNV